MQLPLKFVVQSCLYVAGAICLLVDVLGDDIKDWEGWLLALGLLLLSAAFLTGTFLDLLASATEKQRDRKIDETHKDAATTKRLLEEHLEDFKKAHRNSLLAKYPLGYGMIFTDGRRTINDNAFTVPVEIDWKAFRIANQNNTAKVSLPDMTASSVGLCMHSCVALFDIDNPMPTMLLQTDSIQVTAELFADESSNIAAVVGISPSV